LSRWRNCKYKCVRHSLNVIGKGSKERRILFNNREKLLLQNYLKDRKCEDNSLFCSSKFPYTRLGIRAIEKEIKNIANRSNIDINVFPHLCRHTYGTSKINSGMSIVVLQALLGHSDPSTTMIYSKVNNENINHEYRKSN
jgi:integrase/recombinase XerD